MEVKLWLDILTPVSWVIAVISLFGDELTKLFFIGLSMMLTILWIIFNSINRENHGEKNKFEFYKYEE
ncbi:MAG: hypothetical protein AB7V77_03525 [Candidatus Woesearchaeota archaeon]